MPKVDLAVLKANMRQRDILNPEREATIIFPHGHSGTGKTAVWGMFGIDKPHKALLVQGEKGDRDLNNPDIDILDVNQQFNIGKIKSTVTNEENEDGMYDATDVENAAMGWEYVRAVTDDLTLTGGRNLNPEGERYRWAVFDSGTTFQQMCLAWILKSTPTRKRVAGVEGVIKPSLEDFGDLMTEFQNWLIKLRDLKTRGITVVVIFLTQEIKAIELASDGFSNNEVVKFKPMVMGKKMPEIVISIADFAPFHQQIEQNIMVPDPNNPGKSRPAMKLVRGLRWHPTNKISAKGRGKLSESHALKAPWDLVDPTDPSKGLIGWECHKLNLMKICELGNIPF